MAMIPYYPSRRASEMLARTLTTVGTRANGRVPIQPRNVVWPRASIQPIVPNTNVLSGLGCCEDCATNIPYAAAKRGLGRLGIAYGPPVGAGAGAGAEIGAQQGASIGSQIVPGIGTAIGAVVGAIGGAIAGSINKRDPENYNFDQAVAIWQANPDAVYNIGNKYLPLAGLFDLSLRNPHIPIYQRYGRMGEAQFTKDLVNLLYQAGLNGQITANDTALTIMSRIVQPWIDSWGYGPMQDPHADLITRLIVGMILDYVTGSWKNSWYARGGDFPFNALPMFRLQPVMTAAPAIIALPAPPVPAFAPAPPPPPPAPVVTTPLPSPIPATVAVSAPVTTISPPAAAVTPIIAVPTAPVISQPACTSPLVWNGTQCVQPLTTAPTLTPSGSTPVATVAASPPTGFNVIGTDTSGNPVFSNAAGVLYQWNGTAMQVFAGQLGSGQSVAAQVQAAIQSALAQGQSTQQAAQTALAQAQSQGVQVTPALQAQVADQAQAAATAPTVATAGVSSSSGGLVAILAVVGVLFATARPHKQQQHA